VDVTPPALPNFVLSLTYFDVIYEGQIRPPGSFARLFLTQEAQFAALITRNPTPAQLAAACEGLRFVPGSVGDCDERIAVILDNRFRNLGFVKTHGIDVALDYDFDVARGRLALGVDGTYTIAAEQAITPTSPVLDVVDTVGYPLQLRWAVHVSWSSGGWTAQTAVNYAGGYRDTNSEPGRKVDAWTTVDLNIRYRARAGLGWMAGTECDLGVNNLFDRAPPFVNAFDLDSGTLGYDAANASLVGRLVSLQFVKHWGS
jgi:outer membrane receptor protein involved in Fe transport